MAIWWLYCAKTLRMSAELVFSCGHKPALRYSLISPWTTCLRLIRAVISIRWPGSCNEWSLFPGLVGPMLVVMPRVLGQDLPEVSFAVDKTWTTNCQLTVACTTLIVRGVAAGGSWAAGPL